MTEPHPIDERALILTPTGKDSTLIADALDQRRVDTRSCHDVNELCEQIREGAGAAVVAEEVLGADGLRNLIDVLREQPEWSDLPIILLARRGASSDIVARTLRMLANVTLIERPTQITALTTAVRTALRARMRQYQIRDQFVALKENELELRAADRRKDQFLAMLAHELRNPLQPIGAAAEILRIKSNGDATVTRAADVIDRQTRHLSRLLEDLLDVSRITTGKVVLRREPLDLNIIVGRAVETARGWFLSRRQELDVETPREPVWVDGDPARLQQVISNLLHNASKYTQEGDRIELRLAGDEEGARVTVKDDGIGIERDVLPHVFELFTQADRSLDRSQGGLGIGLSVVKKLAEMHEGRITATSDGAGRGSLFELVLPMIGGPSVSPETAEVKPEESLRHVRRVLVVDDNVDAAQLLCVLLRSHGHDVEVSYDGLDAIERAREMRPDTVVLDIGLPGASGYEVARTIRSERADENVMLVAVTGYGRDEDRERCLDAGFNVHFVKPLEPTKLIELLAA